MHFVDPKMMEPTVTSPVNPIHHSIVTLDDHMTWLGIREDGIGCIENLPHQMPFWRAVPKEHWGRALSIEPQLIKERRQMWLNKSENHYPLERRQK